MNKKLLSMFAICLIFAIALSTTTANALTTGTSSGTATVGAATPTISMTNAGLYNNGGGTAENGVTTLTVLTEYWYNATIGDTNGLYTLLNITFVVFSSGDVAVGAADHNQTHYTFEYLNSSDAYSEVGPNAGGADLVSADCTKPTRSGTSSVIRLAFQVQGVANYTSGATWKVNCTVYCGASGANNCNDQSATFGLAAYYAIVVADATHGWSCSAGDNNDTLTTPAAGYITTYCTSNHYHYKLQAQSEAANLVNGGNTITIGHVLMGQTALATSTNMTTSYTNIYGLTAISPSDAINAAQTFKLWISIPAGTPSGSYTYTLDVQIASDT